MYADLEPIPFEALAGFESDDSLDAFRAFRDLASSLEGASLRAALAAPPALLAAAKASQTFAADNSSQARAFFRRWFEPRRIGSGFVTGYYEPWVRGSLTPSLEFTAPILARPNDLVSFAPGEGPSGFDRTLAGAQRLEDGSLRPYPTRALLESAATNPIVWLADPVEVFLIQVQGCARVELPDGRMMRLVYDGRNGQPYSSIGKLLIESGEIPESEMSLARLKAWLRAQGLAPGERGRELMRRNRSYIFFCLEDGSRPGPTGGAGAALATLRSIAIDRTLWCYGLPFFFTADLPWLGDTPEPFARLMIAADTGSAILGRARADLFFGGGEEAGARAGSLRHAADFVVLAPREQAA